VSIRLLLTVDARSDIADAVAWLKERSPEVPVRFRHEIEQVMESIRDRPEMYPVVHHTVRRALVRHFPYSVFYVVQPESILVLAVMHQARHDSSWRRRSPN
jgi:toxin ParE1/3/4